MSLKYFSPESRARTKPRCSPRVSRACTATLLREKRVLYCQSDGPNPDGFTGTALRHGCLNSLFQVALYICLPGGVSKGRVLQHSCCTVQGSGFRVQGSGFRVQGLRLRGRAWAVAGADGPDAPEGLGCRVQGAGCRVQGAG